MTRFNWLDWTVFVILIVGGLNLGLMGIFGYNVIATFSVVLSRIIFTLMGLSALYAIYSLTKLSAIERMETPKEHTRKTHKAA